MFDTYQNPIVQPVDFDTALSITVRIVAFGLIISALEHFAVLKQFGSNGVFSLRVVSPFRSHATALELTDQNLRTILITQIIALMGLVVFGPFPFVGRVALLVAILASILIRWRRYLGGDGAEQVAMLALLSAALAVWPAPSANRVTLATVFIVAQLGLAYGTSGIAKLISSSWRSGRALPAIMATYSHGHPWAAAFLKQHSGIALLASWSVIIFECLFPILLLGPPLIVLPVLGIGFVFHFACAVLMGLNSFLWSFPALYACAFALSVQRWPLV